MDSELHGKPGTEPGEPNPRRRKRSECNLMGVMVPGPCDALPSAMKIRQEVETTRDRCGPFETPELPEASARVPDDFRVTLRVGRCGAGPRNCPRFTVSLFANGNSVFHGKDWVRTIGRADGRVSTRALGRVTRLLRDLHVFERRSRKTDEAGRCNPVRDQGDVFNIHMNGKYRVLIDRKGCRGAFGRDELKVLRTAIEQVAGVHAWRQGRDRYGVAGQTRWNIP